MATYDVMWWLVLLPSGRWNNHCRVGGIWLADVITNWQMLLPKGYYVLILVLGCLTEPHPICVADGTCQHFCLGMDC